MLSSFPAWGMILGLNHTRAKKAQGTEDSSEPPMKARTKTHTTAKESQISKRQAVNASALKNKKTHINSSEHIAELLAVL